MDVYAVVADDDAMVLMHAVDILHESGFVTLEASSAEEAVEHLERHGVHVSLLFTDVEMPGQMDGFELARVACARWSHIGVLVASGTRAPEDGELPDNAVFVAKPFSAEIVRDRLHQILPDERKPGPLLDHS